MNSSATLTDSLLNYNNGAVVQQIAQQLGIPEDTARSAIESMAPTLTRGIERNIANQGGLDDLLNAVQTGNHERYVDNPELLASPETVADGNAILGHILGSKDVSRNVAAFSGQQVGIDDTLLKMMLPMLAAAAMGMISKQMSRGGNSGGRGSQQDIVGMLSGFLDTNKDGSPVDEILNLAQMFFQRR